MQTIEEQIQNLENKLLHEDVRKNPDVLTLLLAEDFEEIGSSGAITTRAEVVDWLTHKEKDTTWTLSRFSVRSLSDDVVLATYQANQNENTASKGSMRSSIWKNIDGVWKMVFHQATKL